MKPFKPGSIAVLCARTLCAAIIIAFALGYPIGVQTLQVAELATVCFNTLILLMIAGMLAVVVLHTFMGTGLPKFEKRTPTWEAVFGMVFALELAAFGMIGWWFTLGLRITAIVIVKTSLHEA